MVFHYTRSSNPYSPERLEELDDFLCVLECEVDGDEEITAVWLEFHGHLVDASKSECKALLDVLRTSSTLRDVVVLGDGRDLMTGDDQWMALDATRFWSWMLRALLKRSPTLPSLYKLVLGGIDLTAESFAILLQVCRPECFTFSLAQIVTSPAFPTLPEALDHVTSALQNTSTTLKSIFVSVMQDQDASLRATLQGLVHHETLTTAVWGRTMGNPVPLHVDDAHVVVEFLQQSTGRFKGLGLNGFRWQGDGVFDGIATAFQESTSHCEITFESCNFDAASSRRLCSMFSSADVAKGIKIGDNVVFAPQARVLETLAGSSPGLILLGLEDECTLLDLKAVFRGLAKSTSFVPQLLLPSLPVNQLNVLIQALPTFTNLVRLVFQSVQLPLHFKRRLIEALKQNGSLIETTVKSIDKFDRFEIATMKAYHNRNKYLPVAFDSAIEHKVADEAYGPCEFDFSSVPSLLRATVALTVLGPGRFLNVLIRCSDQIGPYRV
jgi:hypothetical protein